MTLSGKFGILRAKMKLDEMSQEQAIFAQGMFISGAQAAFQILAALSASDKSAAEVQLGWHDLQEEIRKANEALTRRAAEKPEDDEEPPEEKRIIVC